MYKMEPTPGETSQETEKKYPKWLDDLDIHPECKAKVCAGLGATGGRHGKEAGPKNPTKPDVETWKTLQEEIRQRAATMTLPPLEMDRRIAYLSMAVDLLQERGWIYDVAQFSLDIAKLIDTKTKAETLLKNLLTTDLIYAKMKDIVDTSLPEKEQRIIVMGAVCDWLDNIVAESLSRVK